MLMDPLLDEKNINFCSLYSTIIDIILYPVNDM